MYRDVFAVAQTHDSNFLQFWRSSWSCREPPWQGPASSAQCRQEWQQDLSPSTAQDLPAARDACEQHHDLEQCHADSDYGGYDGEGD